MRRFISCSLAISALSLSAPQAALPLDYAPTYTINGWEVVCSWAASARSCRTNRNKQPPFVYISVDRQKTILQVRENCSFEGKAPPVTIQRSGKWYRKILVVLNKAQEACPMGSVQPGWAGDTMELVELMAAATGRP